MSIKDFVEHLIHEEPSKQTQCNRILDLLGDGKAHSSLQMTKMYIMRPASRIWDLKQLGHTIEKEMREVTPGGAKVAWYRLAK